MTENHSDFILTLKCPDRPGILAAVTALIFKMNGDIRDAQNFGDTLSKYFYVRMHLTLPDNVSLEDMADAIKPVASSLEFTWNLKPWKTKVRTLLAVSKFGHCLNDLLHRWKSGLLHTEIVGIVSNHEDFRSLAEWYGLPFYYLPVTSDTKPQQEARILEVMEQTQAELLVLARYMQVLSEEMCRSLNGRCINIHHSFLPSFKGASPYKRAYERGVKLVGATAHYVTSDLDEGPIIEQDVVRVTHAMDAEEMTNLGKEVEARVLARAVRWHVEHRVILNGSRTIVFS